MGTELIASHSERLAQLEAYKASLAKKYLRWAESPEAQTLEGRRALMTIQLEESVLDDLIEFVRNLKRKKESKCQQSTKNKPLTERLWHQKESTLA